MARAEQRLADLGVELPPVAAPVAAYVPAVLTGSLVFTSGQLPFVDGVLSVTGKVGDGAGLVSVVDAAAAGPGFGRSTAFVAGGAKLGRLVGSSGLSNSSGLLHRTPGSRTSQPSSTVHPRLSATSSAMPVCTRALLWEWPRFHSTRRSKLSSLSRLAPRISGFARHR